jgi:hypothetical protein
VEVEDRGYRPEREGQKGGSQSWALRREEKGRWAVWAKFVVLSFCLTSAHVRRRPADRGCAAPLPLGRTAPAPWSIRPPACSTRLPPPPQFFVGPFSGNEHPTGMPARPSLPFPPLPAVRNRAALKA